MKTHTRSPYAALIDIGVGTSRLQNGFEACFAAAVVLASTLLSHGDHSGCRWRFEYRKYAASFEAGKSKDTFSSQPVKHETEQTRRSQ